MEMVKPNPNWKQEFREWEVVNDPWVRARAKRNQRNRKWVKKEFGGPSAYRRYLKFKKANQMCGGTLDSSELRAAALSASNPRGGIPHFVSGGSLGPGHTPKPCIECCRKLVTPP